MAPQTRSRVKPAAGKVYHSSPVPTQLRFPARQKVVKTYGRTPSSARSARSLRQQTLTQIDYIQPLEPDPLAMSSEEEAEEEEKPRKRRKTMGDTPSSSFHTQTLTQLLSEKGEEDVELGLVGSSDDGEGAEFGFPEIHQEDNPKKSRGRRTASRSARRAISAVPQTPSRQKTTVDLTEVPSSQSPMTPASTKCFISPLRSPLKDKSSNANASTPILKSIMKRPRNLVVQDSFSSVNGSPSSDHTRTPIKIAHPPQGRQSPDVPGTSLELRDSRTENTTVGQEIPIETPRKSIRRVWVEVPDSDAELESVGPSPEKDDTIPATPRVGSKVEETTLGTHDSSHEQGKDGPGPCDGEAFSGEPGTPTPLARKVQLQLPSQEPEEAFEAIPTTPSQKSAATPKGAGRETQARSQFFTQTLESQRIPLEVVRSMGPQTDRSDIIISIHPEPVENIVNGTKNYEFRNYKIPAQVSRIWIYVTHPVCELRYMATIGPAKQPGEIDSESGLGNADFNSGKSGYKFAHELQQVYQLNNAVALETMKENGWLGGPPQKYAYAPPAVVGQLLANLRCALFDEGGSAADDQGMSTSQEVEEQLRCDIIHSTQLACAGHNAVIPSSRGPSPDVDGPLPREPRPPAEADSVFAKPPLPAARNQSQVPTNLTAGAVTPRAVRPSQATTASEPSSPVHSPEKPPLLTVHESSPIGPSQSFPDYADDGSSPPRFLPGGQFSLASSQPMLPDSLLVDDVRQPPPVILDSDDEGSDG